MAKQRKYAGRLAHNHDALAITAAGNDSLDLSLSPSSGSGGERLRPVVMSFHGAIAAAGTVEFLTEASGTTIAGPFAYGAGVFEASYSPGGLMRGGFGENLVVSASQDADILITWVMEPEDN